MRPTGAQKPEHTPESIDNMSNLTKIIIGTPPAQKLF
jgi:hypothetical protein